MEKYFLFRGCDLNKWDVDGFTPVMIAGQKGHHNVVKLLVNSGARLDIQNKSDHTFFHVCAEYGQHKIIKMVIHEKGDEALELLKDIIHAVLTGEKFRPSNCGII